MVKLVAGGTIDFTLTDGQIDKHKNRDLANQLETPESFQQQEEGWSTDKQVLLTSGQGSAVV